MSNSLKQRSSQLGHAVANLSFASFEHIVGIFVLILSFGRFHQSSIPQFSESFHPYCLAIAFLVFQLPLQPKDDEPIVNLYEVLEEVYEEAALNLVIDYSQQLPLSPKKPFSGYKRYLNSPETRFL